MTDWSAPPGAYRDEPDLIARMRAAPAPAFLGWLEALAALACLFLFSQALVGPLFADSVDEDSAILRMIWIPVYGLTLLLILMRPGPMLAAALRSKLILALAGIAIASTLWSIAPDVSLRRGFALLMTTAFGLWLGARWEWPKLLELFAALFASLAVMSVIAAIVFPGFGVDQAVHAGAWKGVWWEKNTLGAMMAWGAIACCAAAAARPERALIWVGFAALCAFLVLMSTSKTALLAFLLGAGGLAGIAISRRGFGFAALMLFGLAFGLLGGIAIALIAPVEALEALGRDATLTGRTDIWVLLADEIAKRPWTGYGYMAFWTVDDGPVFWLRQATVWPVPTAHNGWIETALAIGLPGATLLAIVYLGGLFRAFTRLFAGVEAYWALPFIAMLGLVSMSESNLMAQNGLSWVMFTATVTRLSARSR